MKLPEWTSKVREWRLHFESTLDPHFRDKASKVGIVHSFREDMTMEAGRYVHAPGAFHEIFLSIFLTEEEAKMTYGHEYAHFLACLFYGDATHGFIWKSFMSLFGLAAAQFHTIPLHLRCMFGDIQEKIDNQVKEKP
jgi:hypothetical protein